MPIGTSLGAYYDDGFHQSTAQWDPDKYDENEKTHLQTVIDAKTKPFSGTNGDDDMIRLPLEVQKGEMENNITDPKIMQGNIMTDQNPHNIYNDKGDIVDFDLTGMGPTWGKQ